MNSSGSGVFWGTVRQKWTSFFDPKLRLRDKSQTRIGICETPIRVYFFPSPNDGRSFGGLGYKLWGVGGPPFFDPELRFRDISQTRIGVCETPIRVYIFFFTDECIWVWGVLRYSKAKVNVIFRSEAPFARYRPNSDWGVWDTNPSIFFFLHWWMHLGLGCLSSSVNWCKNPAKNDTPPIFWPGDLKTIWKKFKRVTQKSKMVYPSKMVN